MISNESSVVPLNPKRPVPPRVLGWAWKNMKNTALGLQQGGLRASKPALRTKKLRSYLIIF